jgi:RHS repeat-associated protein
MLSYLSVDHLGTPILQTNASGSSLWSGGFEPFGKDWSGAQAAGEFLRFPGQWEDGSWAEVGSAIYYNVRRWFEVAQGKYTNPDPLGLAGSPYIYSYAINSPLNMSDPLGLKVELYCHPIGAGGTSLLRRAIGAAGFGHCFLRVKCDCPTYDLRLEVAGRGSGGKAEIDPPSSFTPNHSASIVPISPGDWDSRDCRAENCILNRFDDLRKAGYAYPVSGYILGPNSNVFAVDLLQACGFKRIYLPMGLPPFDNWSYPLLPPVPTPSLE